MHVSLAFVVILVSYQTSESLQRMQAALERQRASVRKQVKGEAGPFFTTAWFEPRPPETTPSVQAPCEAVPAQDLWKLIVETATKEGLNPLLLRAVVNRESGGRPCAVSSKGAEGLMQLMPSTSSDLGVRDAFDAAENIAGGARYLKQMLERYQGDLRLALAAYNAGPQRVDDAKGVPPIAETQAYVEAIMKAVNAATEPAP